MSNSLGATPFRKPWGLAGVDAMKPHDGIRLGAEVDAEVVVGELSPELRKPRAAHEPTEEYSALKDGVTAKKERFFGSPEAMVGREKLENVKVVLERFRASSIDSIKWTLAAPLDVAKQIRGDDGNCKDASLIGDERRPEDLAQAGGLRAREGR